MCASPVFIHLHMLLPQCIPHKLCNLDMSHPTGMYLQEMPQDIKKVYQTGINKRLSCQSYFKVP